MMKNATLVEQACNNGFKSGSLQQWLYRIGGIPPNSSIFITNHMPQNWWRNPPKTEFPQPQNWSSSENVEEPPNVG